MREVDLLYDGNDIVKMHALLKDRVHDMSSTLTELQFRSTWSPISAAPRDGTLILVWMDFQRPEDAGGVFTAVWVDGVDEDDPGGWFAYNPSVKDGSMELMRYEPSHWQHLPKSPYARSDLK